MLKPTKMPYAIEFFTNKKKKAYKIQFIVLNTVKNLRNLTES